MLQVHEIKIRRTPNFLTAEIAGRTLTCPSTSERVNFVVNVGVRFHDGPASISIRKQSLSLSLPLVPRVSLSFPLSRRLFARLYVTETIQRLHSRENTSLSPSEICTLVRLLFFNVWIIERFVYVPILFIAHPTREILILKSFDTSV